MLETKIEEKDNEIIKEIADNNCEKEEVVSENAKKIEEAIANSKKIEETQNDNKTEYLEHEKDNEAKLEFLKEFKDKESRDKIINSLEHKVSPDLFRIVYLAQRMIREFIKDVYINVPDSKLEAIEITFNRTNIIINKLPENYNMEVDSKTNTITIQEKRSHNQSKLLGYVLHGYAHSFSNMNLEAEKDTILEEGNADIFTDLVVNNYIEKHPFENIGFHIKKDYTLETAYTESDSIIRSRMYVLEKLKIDKKMLLEFLLGDKNKYLKNIYNGGPKYSEFNLNEFYEKNKFALQDIDRKSIYYRKNAILPLFILQKEIPNENILEKEYSALELIKKRFNYERINKINADELDNFINIIKDTNKIKNNLKEYIKTELEELTEMEKRTSCNNILENVLVFCKYEKLELDVANQVLDIIKYAINDLERNIELKRTAQLLQKINEQSSKIELEDKNLEDEIKDSFSYLKIKLEMSNNGNLTSNAFFNRLQKSLKNGSKIERNEELIGYQTIKDELNINKK